MSNFLLQGRTFYLTPSIQPSWKKLKLVIECAGGKVENRRRKNVDEIRTLNAANADSPVYLIITCEHDLHIVTDVLKAKIGIFNAEFVMSAVMKGKIDFDLTHFLTTIWKKIVEDYGRNKINEVQKTKFMTFFCCLHLKPELYMENQEKYKRINWKSNYLLLKSSKSQKSQKY